MAVTTLNTIKFSDVCLEIWGSTSTVGKTLLGAFSAATGTFNTSYSVSGNTLLDFRGYTHISNDFFDVAFNTNGYSTSSLSCSNGYNSLKYMSDGLPEYNGRVYNDSALTSVFYGENKYYKLDFYTVKINLSGYIKEVISCG